MPPARDEPFLVVCVCMYVYVCVCVCVWLRVCVFVFVGVFVCFATIVRGAASRLAGGVR